MDDVKSVDSAGLAAIVGLWVEAVRNGTEISISCRNRRISKLFRITGLDYLFNMDSTGEEAARLADPAYGNSRTLVKARKVA
jgi:anti-anti-sigma factor